MKKIFLFIALLTCLNVKSQTLLSLEEAIATSLKHNYDILPVSLYTSDAADE
jgi:hypothetical protein